MSANDTGIFYRRDGSILVAICCTN